MLVLLRPEGYKASMAHDETPNFDPATAPEPDKSGLNGLQLILLMGGVLLAACIFLDIVSG
jgi:hypothetical protein